jgi:hypothetical protein
MTAISLEEYATLSGPDRMRLAADQLAAVASVQNALVFSTQSDAGLGNTARQGEDPHLSKGRAVKSLAGSVLSGEKPPKATKPGKLRRA